MKFTNLLLKVELMALISLLLCSALMSAYAGIHVYFGPPNVLSSYETVLLVFIDSVIVGGLAVIIYGAPIYTVMQFYNKAKWLFVVVLGVIPGIGIIIFDSTIGYYAIACGLGVAVITHLVFIKYSNKSFKMDGAKRRAAI